MGDHLTGLHDSLAPLMKLDESWRYRRTLMSGTIGPEPASVVARDGHDDVILPSCLGKQRFTSLLALQQG
jgi:hypothetical protein